MYLVYLPKKTSIFLPLIMASKSIILSFILFHFHFLHPTVSEFPTARATEPDTSHEIEVFNIEAISNALSDKGYLSMALSLQLALKSNLIPSEVSDDNTRVTIFCPPNKAFSELKYPQPPLTLLQYQISPSELNREALESSLGPDAKVHTFLSGHSLVITTEPGSRETSINEVKITEWDVYNDGSVIVHAVEDFFDPAFQTLRHPWYDDDNDKVIKNDERGPSQKEDPMRMLLYVVIGAIFLGYPQAGILLIIMWFFMPSRLCTCRP